MYAACARVLRSWRWDGKAEKRQSHNIIGTAGAGGRAVTCAGGGTRHANGSRKSRAAAAQRVRELRTTTTTGKDKYLLGFIYTRA